MFTPYVTTPTIKFSACHGHAIRCQNKQVIDLGFNSLYIAVKLVLTCLLPSCTSLRRRLQRSMVGSSSDESPFSAILGCLQSSFSLFLLINKLLSAVTVAVSSSRAVDSGLCEEIHAFSAHAHKGSVGGARSLLHAGTTRQGPIDSTCTCRLSEQQ